MNSTCKSCGAAIRWVTMPSGKRMPLDAAPHPDGHIAIHSDGLRAAVLSTIELAEYRGRVDLYRSHFATCPQADRHRK